MKRKFDRIENKSAFEELLKLHKKNSPFDTSYTLLHMACQYSADLEMVKYRVEQAENECRATNSDGDTPLHLASYHNTNPEIIKYLVETAQCDINIKNNYRFTPLHLACWKNNNPEIIKYLVETPTCDFNALNEDGDTPLHLACVNTNPEVVKFLVGTGKFDVNIQNSSGRTPLHAACRYKNASLEIVKCLVEIAKCNTNLKAYHDHTPLHFACQYNDNPDIVKYLIETVKCNVNAKTHNNETPLSLALSTAQLYKRYEKEVPEQNLNTNNIKHIIKFLLCHNAIAVNLSSEKKVLAHLYLDELKEPSLYNYNYHTKDTKDKIKNYLVCSYLYGKNHPIFKIPKPLQKIIIGKALSMEVEDSLDENSLGWWL